MAVALALGLLLAAPPPADAQAPPRAADILARAQAAPDDPAVLGKALGEIDAALARAPKDADAHFTRGWILSHLGRGEEAVAAYDRALELDPRNANSAYNAGVVLADLGRDEDAALRWKAALAADPEHLDAAYNLGQRAYNRKDFKAALAYWQQARAIAPGDFDVVKKVLQAQNALGRAKDAAKTRDELFRMWRESKDERVRALRDYVFDQFDVGELHVFAYETFVPSGDAFTVYRFSVTDKAQRRTIGSVQLESSAELRAKGTPYALGVWIGGERVALDVRFKSIPKVPALRKKVEALVRKHLVPAAAAPR